MIPCPTCGQPCEKKVIGKSSFPQYQPDDVTYTPIHPKELSVKDIAKLLPKGIAMCYQNIDIATRIHRAVYGGKNERP